MSDRQSAPLESPSVVLIDAARLSRLLERAAAGDVLSAAVRGLTELSGARGGACLMLAGEPRVRASTDPSRAATFADLAEHPAVARALREGLELSIDLTNWRSPGSAADPTVSRWIWAIPLVSAGRSFGLILAEIASAPQISSVANDTARMIGQIAAGLLVAQGALDATLPVAATSVHRTATPIWGVSIMGNAVARRILVVEDDPDIGEAVRSALVDENYEVTVLTRGDEAMESLRRTTPDLVVLDVRLPDRDGFSVAREMARDRRTTGVPILFLSGTEDLATRVRGLHSEEADFLPKPFSFRDLVTRVQQSILRAQNRNRLLQSSRIDELTGLGNLRLLEERLVVEAARLDRYSTPLTLVVMDLDKLKTINDRHGHAVGSGVLRAVGDVLKHAIRETDLAVRYGGDEFVVLLPHTELSQGVAFGERVLTNIRAARPNGLSISVSLGIAAFDPAIDESVERLFDRADQAAYRAKREGGDRLHADQRPVPDPVGQPLIPS